MHEHLMLDIGGTFVKRAYSNTGEYSLLPPCPIDQGADCDTLIQSIVDIVGENEACDVTVCMPGPVDYQHGVFMMKHKFASLYGINVKERLESLFPKTRFLFLHDVMAFLLGEAEQGKLRDIGCGASVMLGTGIGFCLCKNGKGQLNQYLRPAHSLWNVPYRDSIVEEYISARGIMKRYSERAGKQENVYTICMMARNGDTIAQDTMEETGIMLGEVLQKHLQGYDVEKIVFGGQISKSLDVMEKAIASTLSVRFESAAFLDDAALRGCLAYARLGSSTYDILPE